LLFAATAFAVLACAASGRLYSYLAPIAWLERTGLRLCGICLLSLSLIWTAIAQAQMGASWRIGIDSKHRTELVESGVFGWSRNPIFLGMIATMLGLFSTAPNALTLLIAGLVITLIQIQVRLEEEHLGHLHGAAYQTYRLRVPRWL
jgi:protein-S-isoprenylcysteine O-methyltransferase Ste14